MPRENETRARHNALNARWTDEDKQVLRDLADADDATVIAAFPTRSLAAIRVAQRRCTTRADAARPPRAIDGSDVRRRLRDLPLTTFIDRLPDLVKRSESFGRPLETHEDVASHPIAS